MEFFYKNLQNFQKYELEALKRVENLNNTKLKNLCDNNKYDFKTIDNIKYEVKTEPKSLTTNNFFIEFKGYNKPSGITTTRSNYYIINDTINYYMIKTEQLKYMISTNKYKVVNTKDNLTFGYLISKHEIICNSIKI